MKYGGKCKLCGYNKCLAALDFHHLNLQKKIMGLAKIFDQLGKAAAYREAEKCLLVCSNCHREIHAGVLNGRS